MKKFIVTFSECSEPCSYEWHVAVECESIEELYMGLMDAAMQRIKFREKGRPGFTPWGESKIAYDIWEKENKVTQYPIVCGSKFDIDSIIHTRQSKLVVDDIPDIMTLDRWFEEHKK